MGNISVETPGNCKVIEYHCRSELEFPAGKEGMDSGGVGRPVPAEGEF